MSALIQTPTIALVMTKKQNFAPTTTYDAVIEQNISLIANIINS